MSTDPTVPLPEPDAVLADCTGRVEQNEPIEPEGPAPVSAAQPRTRWAAIVWGVCFAVLAGYAIWMLGSGDRRDDVSDWFASLTPGTVTALALLTVGALVLVSGAVGLIRRAQRSRL
ncbi:hypothetical protein [Microbacterium soli]|uniref:Uncharacterized protein n=1 Tax=Microbacterium soli TaxID=446075 RepID=A0ABP7N8U6_9MICO